MITLFLAFPIVGNSAEDLELSYLKTLESPTPEEVKVILTQALKCSKIVSLDDSAVVYDHARFSPLIKIVKDDQKEKKTKENPDISRLVILTKKWIDCNQMKGGFAPVNVNDVAQTQGILCAYVNIRQNDHDLLVNNHAIDNIEGLRVTDNADNTVEVNFIAASQKDIYKWFADHRCPERMIDEAYDKHPTKETDSKEGKKGKKGVRISSNTYKKTDAEDRLKWAVGSKTNETNRMYFLDKEKKKLLIFWNEDDKEENIHVYQVDEDDTEELSKIWTYKDGRDLFNKIREITELYVPGHE